MEKLFIPGGFALTHSNNHTDVSVPEAVPLEDIDASSVKENYNAAVQQAAAAAEVTLLFFQIFICTLYFCSVRAINIGISRTLNIDKLAYYFYYHYSQNYQLYYYQHYY